MIRHHVDHFLRGWFQHTFLQLATLSVLTGVFSVISVSFLIRQNVNSLLTHWGSSIKMSLFLDEGISETQMSELNKNVKDKSDDFSYRFISKDDAIVEFQKSAEKNLPKFIFDESFGNPLPASFELEFANKKGGFNYEKLVDLGKYFAALAGVEEVSYGQGWVENFAYLFDRVNYSGVTLVLVLLLGSLFVFSNSIGNSVNQRRDEIEILELIGATKWHIMGPYLFEGAIMGALSAVLGLILCFLLFTWQSDVLSGNMGQIGISKDLLYLSFWNQFLIIFAGTSFGICGSYLSVKRVGTGWAAASTEG